MRIQSPADLARTIKTRRQARGLTQQDIADAVGITRQSLARIERGHGGVSFDTVLRILETLELNLEATTTAGHQGQFTFAVPALSNDAVRQATSDIVAKATQNLDTSAIANAAAAAARNIDTSALAAATYRHIDTSTIAEAATAAARNIDPSVALSSWRAALDALASQVQQTAARTGFEPSVLEARKALLKSTIEAGDPDREGAPDGEAVTQREESDGAADG
jgi:transcriptional regulator with XRE-family HTH domain